MKSVQTNSQINAPTNLCSLHTGYCIHSTYMHNVPQIQRCVRSVSFNVNANLIHELHLLTNNNHNLIQFGFLFGKLHKISSLYFFFFFWKFISIIRYHLTCFVAVSVLEIIHLKYTRNNNHWKWTHTHIHTRTLAHTHTWTEPLVFVEQSSHAFSGKQLRNAETNALNVPFVLNVNFDHFQLYLKRSPM